MANGTFSAGQVAMLADVSVKTLRGWVESGLLQPAVQKSAGHGSERVYDFADAAAIHAVALARRFGVSLDALVPLVREIRAAIPDEEAADRTSNILVVLLEGKALTTTSDQLANVLRQCETPVVVAFSVASISAKVLLQLTVANLTGTLPRRRGRPRKVGSKAPLRSRSDEAPQRKRWSKR